MKIDQVPSMDRLSRPYPHKLADKFDYTKWVSDFRARAGALLTEAHKSISQDVSLFCTDVEDGAFVLLRLIEENLKGC